MSTPRKGTKPITKRRAAARRRTRHIAKLIFTYSMVGILLLGVVSSVFIFQAPQNVAPVDTFPTPTQQVAGLQTLLTEADKAYTEGRYQEAVSYYRSYLSLDTANANNGELNYKLGRAYLNLPTPDHAAGVDHLQRAVSIDPDAVWAQQANELIAANKDKAAASATITGTTTLTGTGPITDTAPITP